eukprot:2443306-Rhodomonas_salina.1
MPGVGTGCAQWDVDVGLLEWETRLDEKPRPYLRVKVGDGKSEGNAEGKESKVHPKVCSRARVGSDAAEGLVNGDGRSPGL